jgi:hypothetical protein
MYKKFILIKDNLVETGMEMKRVVFAIIMKPYNISFSVVVSLSSYGE